MCPHPTSCIQSPNGTSWSGLDAGRTLQSAQYFTAIILPAARSWQDYDALKYYAGCEVLLASEPLQGTFMFNPGPILAMQKSLLLKREGSTIFCVIVVVIPCGARVRVRVKKLQPGPLPAEPGSEPAGLRVDHGSRLARAGRDLIAGIMIFVTCLQHVTCTLRQPAGFGSRNSSTRDPDPVNPTRKPAGLTRTRAPPYASFLEHAGASSPEWYFGQEAGTSGEYTGEGDGTIRDNRDPHTAPWDTGDPVM
ncbi:hypothetical protein GGX14DRAFT_389158 [Mycena pura]|uniref:Uncharacterized protein n=1 Tax=Mycena pura TaxID=153505 RepID=A0AAD6VUS6_9AGAR|nr:hypothetical protein GGX14DRAFT_389158 [Mycena pura]